MTVDEAAMASMPEHQVLLFRIMAGVFLTTPWHFRRTAEDCHKVKGKTVILADGAVRYGTDVLKMLALGADAVLVGRPLLRGAVGGARKVWL